MELSGVDDLFIGYAEATTGDDALSAPCKVDLFMCVTFSALFIALKKRQYLTQERGSIEIFIV